MARKSKPQPKPQPTASGLKPFYVVLGVVAVVGVAILAYQFAGGGGASGATEPVAIDVDPAELQRVQGISIGRDDAPVVIWEFADFQCPGCGDFATFVTPLIRDRLVDEGLVRYVYYDYPLISIHPNAFLAARAGRCANEQDRFWEYHDIIYARQATWSTMRGPTDFFVDLAGEAGLDRSTFGGCLRSDRYAEEVTRSLRFGESLGVDATPTLFVNMKRLPSIPSFGQLEQMVREEAGAASPPAPADTAAAETAAAAG